MRFLIVMLALASIVSCCCRPSKPFKQSSLSGTVMTVREVASRDVPPSWWSKTLTLDTDIVHHYWADPRDVAGLPHIEKGDTVFITYEETGGVGRRIKSIRKQ
jgi:hypothetical protein